MTDNQSPELFGQTPSQTVGPFFHYAMPGKGVADLIGSSVLGARPDLVPEVYDLLHVAPARGKVQGTAVELYGTIYDGEGQPVPDAMVELWQANAAGRYNAPQDGRDELPVDPAFVGFGRSATAADGTYRFRTILPGRVPGPGNTLQAPHVALSILGRGLLRRLVTRLYFAGAEGNDDDPVLNLVPAERRQTLLAEEDAGGGSWRLDIRLQGDGETVFFEI